MRLIHPDAPDVVIERRTEDAVQYLKSGWVEVAAPKPASDKPKK